MENWYKEMTDSSKTLRPDKKYFGVFSCKFREKVHILIYWGYKDTLSRINHHSHDEDTITGYISEAIEDRLDAIDAPEWCGDFALKENNPQRLEGHEGNKRPKPDLVIEGTMRKRPKYLFEAKRLKKSDFGVGKYLGQEGLGCFVSGRYASRYAEAAMLGYVQSDSPQAWQKEIQEKINKNKETLDLVSLSRSVQIVSDFPHEWMTVHRRKVIKKAISIYHILLDFRSRG